MKTNNRKDYGDKTDYRKIEIFRDGVYVGTTTWAKNRAEAKARYIEKYPLTGNITTSYITK